MYVYLFMLSPLFIAQGNQPTTGYIHPFHNANNCIGKMLWLITIKIYLILKYFIWFTNWLLNIMVTTNSVMHYDSVINFNVITWVSEINNIFSSFKQINK